MTAGGSLRRDLGLLDAVVVGVGSMIGAGVFTVWGPAAGAAGTALLVGLGVAAVVAFCNATSSAQLAAIHPESGGTYVYARHQLSPAWGHVAGWGFVIGKTASCAAVALTAGAYLWPAHDRVLAIVAVAFTAAINVGGLSRTVAVTKLLLVTVLAVLVIVVVAGWEGDQTSTSRITPFDAGVVDVLRSAGFLFFAFAGYARIATLGEEVRDPARTIPRAIPAALLGVLAVYSLVAVTVLCVVPVEVLARSDAPLRLVVEASGLHRLAPLVRIGAGVAAVGVLLNLLPGVSRTTLAMARRSELPGWLAHVDDGRHLPLRAELSVTAVVVALVTVTDLRGAIGFSSVAVLVYYAVTNAAALTLDRHQRRWPRAIAVVGVVGCVALVVTLPLESVLLGAAVLAAGVLARLTRRHLGRRR